MADPNHVVLHGERLVVLLPCKCAQTTIKDALGRVVGVRPDQFTYTSLSEIPNGFDVVGAIREPVRRAYSGWRHLYAEWSAQTFVDHVAGLDDVHLDQHVRSQSFDLCYEGAPRPDEWLRVDSLTTDWLALCSARGWPITPLGRLNVGRADADWWTPAQVKTLRDRFADDCALYAKVQGWQ